MSDDIAAIYRCGVLIDGTGAPAAEGVAVTVQNGIITAIEPWTETMINSPVEVIDFSDCTVMPGIIDAHTHLCDASDGIPGVNGPPDDVAVVSWGLAASVSAVMAGITTVADLGSPSGLAVRVANLVKSGLARGPLIIAAGPAITTTAGHGTNIGAVADTADEVVRAVRRCVASGSDIIKLMVTGGADDETPTNRRRAQYTEEQLTAGIADAHRLGKKVVGHANGTEGIRRAVTAGIDMVAHCNWLGETSGTIDLDEKTIDMMRERGTRIDLNIQGATRDLITSDGTVLHWPFPDPLPTTRWELLAPLRRQGIKVHLTSDAYGPAIGSFTASLVLFSLRWPMRAEELVSIVTGEPAAALGIREQRGTIEVGSAADLIVVSGDLRKDFQEILRPLRVIRDGVVLSADGYLVPSPVSMSGGEEAESQQMRMERKFVDLM